MYKLFVGNPYEIFEEGDCICTTTNGVIRNNGYAVMGAGNAKFVRDTFGVDEKLGVYLSRYGNRVFLLGTYTYKGKMLRLATFPTKHNYQDKSDLSLIELSTKQVVALADKFNLHKVYIPLPGGSNGKLVWSQVKDRLEGLDERFIVYSLNGDDFNK